MARLVPTTEEFHIMERMATAYAKSGLYKLNGNIALAMSMLLKAYALDIPVAQAFEFFHNMSGKLSVSATGQAFLLKRAGFSYTIVSLTDKRCELAIFNSNGDHVGPSEFSIEDANKAGLSGGNWNKYPRNMVFARAISNAVTWYAPEATGGAPAYTNDELSNGEDAIVPDVDELMDMADDVPTPPESPPVDEGQPDGWQPDPKTNPLKAMDRMEDDEPTPTENVDKLDQYLPKQKVDRQHSQDELSSQLRAESQKIDLMKAGKAAYGSAKAFDEVRSAHIGALTNGRTTTSKEITAAECNFLVQAYNCIELANGIENGKDELLKVINQHSETQYTSGGGLFCVDADTLRKIHSAMATKKRHETLPKAAGQ